MITAINSEVDYRTGLAEIEQLIDHNVRAGTPEGDRLNLLTLLVQDYEQKRIELEAPDPIEAIKFRMDQQGLTRRDLEELIGTRTRIAEILNRKARAVHRHDPSSS